MSQQTSETAVRKSVTVDCSTENAFRVFTEEVGAWWPFEKIHSVAKADVETVIISTNDRQLARLAVALRAAGLKPRDVEEQFLHLHPEIALPEGFEALRADRAAALLAGSARSAVA